MNIDPVIITAHILVALQQIVSRMTNPTLPTVLSFGKLIANGAINVIPDEVYIEGTFRTLDESWRSEAHERIKKIAENLAESMGGTCDCKIVRGYPFLINEENLTMQIQSFAKEYLGTENVIDADIWMAAEDFAWYSQVADSCPPNIPMPQLTQEVVKAAALWLEKMNLLLQLQIDPSCLLVSIYSSCKKFFTGQKRINNLTL